MTVRLFAVMLCLATRTAFAQQADIIRGRVTSDKGVGIENATVQATSIPNNVQKTVRTDRDGRYTITFAGGDGDYWISVGAVGFAPRRFELKRIADEDILIGDVKLQGGAVTLDAVRVQGDRTRVARNDNATDVSGTEKSVNATGVNPGVAGNLAAIAASQPGVQLIPGADGAPDLYSVFGLGGDQNGATLNGLNFGGGDVPRDAATRTTLGTSLWDVSRGGFSGAQFSLRTQSGSNFSSRATSSVLNAPALEWTDRAGRATGAEFASLSLGAATSGPIATDRTFYNAGYQYDRRVSDLPNLLSANAIALSTAGVSPDSVERMRSILNANGIPISGIGLPGSRVNDRASVLAAFDFAPPASTSGQSLNVTLSGNFNRLNAPFGRATATTSTDAARTNLFGALQARHTNYFSAGVLTETSVGITRSTDVTKPYSSLPFGGVRVSSQLDDGALAVSSLSFGGGPGGNSSTTLTSLAAQNQLSWFSRNNRHRLKLTSELRLERFVQDANFNRNGMFVYNSLDELSAGKPSSYSRLLSPRTLDGNELVGALALGDSWRPTSDLQVQYGVRLDANYFATPPARNEIVGDMFGSDNARVPNSLYASPRVGFAWTYGQAAQVAMASGFVRGPRAVVRGGVGVFQNVPRAMSIAGALSNTGLPGSLQQLQCVGSAIPVPNWSAYAADASSIPTTCADGSAGTIFANASPNVSLFDASFKAPRSLRANLNWNGAVLGNRLSLFADGTYAVNQRQPGMYDLNFRGESQFLLGNEGGRPVFVQPSSIVPTTGAMALTDARVSPAFARVNSQRSDLGSASQQLMLSVRPMSFSSTFSWELSYVYSRTREQVNGFTSTAGLPTERVWSNAALDSRHQVVYSLSYNLLNWFPISLTGSFRSGKPFTPLVGGDINGDGYQNDRAFVFNPANTTSATVSSGMQSLLSNGSPAARSCLNSQLGKLAARSSCRMPWTAQSNLTIGINPLNARLPQRLNISLYLNNLFGAADLLFNGEKGRRGWGQVMDPEQTLLYVRGFDPATRTFRYDVNPRFGATNPSQTLNRNPVSLSAVLRVDIGYARERQLLSQSLDRGRVKGGQKSSDTDIRNLAGVLIPPNPMTVILAQADSLKLTRRQADSISLLNRRYTLRFENIWTPVATYLAALPPQYDRGDAYERYRKAREESVDLLLQVVPVVRKMLSPQQLRLLPASIVSSLDERYLAAVRSSTAGGANIGILGMLAQMGATGVSADAQTVMIHR